MWNNRDWGGLNHRKRTAGRGQRGWNRWKRGRSLFIKKAQTEVADRDGDKCQTNCITHWLLYRICPICPFCCICCICHICRMHAHFQKKPCMIRLSDCLKTHRDFFGRTENTARCVSSQHLRTYFFVSSFFLFSRKKGLISGTHLPQPDVVLSWCARGMPKFFSKFCLKNNIGAALLLGEIHAL
jgi:hypothetical protein